MTTAPIESHAIHSERLIAHAERELANGDRLQASEKAWGATAHKLKEIANRRGWRYITHAHVYGIVENLVDELGDETVNDLFTYAVNLHRNYYIDSVPIPRLEFEINKVKQLLRILQSVE